jgi:hypothetical protein
VDQGRAIAIDLILRELATGTEPNIGNVAEFAFDRLMVSRLGD